jgi:REP element-mobilizing transposase RayT
MTVFNSKERNVLHYLTFVVLQRVRVFADQGNCQLFIEALDETRKQYPFKLIAYVIMPDHVHLIVNPAGGDIELVGKTLKGKSAKKILDRLKIFENGSTLSQLKRSAIGKRNHTFSLWQKKVKSVDLWTHKFILQKMNYVHMNPVRAALCDHPGKWVWSSYSAYVRNSQAEIPIQPDRQGYWPEEQAAV